MVAGALRSILNELHDFEADVQDALAELKSDIADELALLAEIAERG